MSITIGRGYHVADSASGRLQSNALLQLASAPADVLVAQIRSGLDGALVKAFLHDLEIPAPEFADAVGMSFRTLSRRYNERLTGEDAAKVVRYAKVFARAIETFGSTKQAYIWLQRPNRSLSAGATPASLLDTEFGAEEVNDALLRMQHGVFC